MSRDSHSTAGQFLKSFNRDYVYKLSAGDSRGIYGHESVNEVIISNLLEFWNIPHITYYGTVADIQISKSSGIMRTYVCYAKNFSSVYKIRMSLETISQMCGVDTDEDFIKLFPEVATMIMVDYIIRNLDRHGANIEIYFYETIGDYKRFIMTVLRTNGRGRFIRAKSRIYLRGSWVCSFGKTSRKS